MNKALILTFALVAGGTVVWLVTRSGGAGAPSTSQQATPTASNPPKAADPSLQAPPEDAGRGSQAATASNAAGANGRAAPVPVAAEPVAPPQVVTIAPVSVSPETEKVSDSDAVFADRYAKLGAADRLAKLEELSKLYESHLQGTLVGEHKLDEARISEIQAEMDWLAANPGN